MMTDPYTAPDFGSIALITIDTQCDTLDGGPLEVTGTSAIVPSIARLADAFRLRRLPIIHIVRLYLRDGSNVDLSRRQAVEQGAPILTPGSEGCQLARGLLPRSGIRLDADQLLAGRVQTVSEREFVIYKPRWGAFYGTPLERHLRSLGVTTLAFCGCNFPNCPRTSIYEATERDFRVVLVRDAVSGLYDVGEKELKNIGVVLMSTDEVLGNLESGSTLKQPSGVGSVRGATGEKTVTPTEGRRPESGT